MNNRIALFPILLLGFKMCVAQNSLVIKHDAKGASSETKSLKKGVSYEVSFEDTHNDIMSLKTEIVTYDIVSNTPDATKFLGIPSTEAFSRNFGFRVTEGGGVIRRNLYSIMDQIDKYHQFHQAMTSKIGSELAKWPTDSIDPDKILDIANEASGDEITKADIETIQYLLASNELWAAYINNLATNRNDSTFLDLIDTFSRFMSKRELLKSNSAKYIQSIKVMDNIKNPPEEKKTILLVGDSFTAKGDLTRISYAIKNKLTSDTLATGTLAIPTSGYWTMDFSTGFYWNQLTNDSFTLSSYSADSTTITFVRDYDASNDIAAGGQLNLSYMVSGTFGIGFNTGAAVSLFDGSIKYLAGGHLKFGSRKQLMLSGGVAIGKVKRISEAVSTQKPPFEESGNEIIVPAKFPEPKFVDNVKMSGFVGLSYNLSNTLKKKK